MKFYNLLYTTIINNLGMIIMVSMGFKSFGISFKWILLFGVVSLYIKYELSKRGIIKNETKLQNIPYTKNLSDLLIKIKQFKPYNPEIVDKIISDINHFFYICDQINNNKNLQFCNQYTEKLDSKIKLILNNFNSLVHSIQNNPVLKKYHKEVILEIQNNLMPYFKQCFNKCIIKLEKNINSNVQLPQTNLGRVETANIYSLSGNNFILA
jgi:hypothetical protein